MFLANYSDGISDLPLDELVADFTQQKVVATFASVKARQTFHTVQAGGGRDGHRHERAERSGIWINGGYFVLRGEIFDYMKEGEELVVEPFERLIEKSCWRPIAIAGFWQRWIRSRTRSRWTAWKPRAIAHGWYGSAAWLSAPE